MAKNEKTAVAVIPADADITTMDLKQLGKSLEKMSYGENDELTSEYINFEVGEEVRAFIVGLVKITKKGGQPGELSDAVKLLLPDGSFGINADAVVVSTLRDLPLNTPVCIQCTGKTKSSRGEYKTFKAFKLS